MRRILITDKVAKLAKDYRDNLFKKRRRDFVRPLVLLKSLLNDINAKKGKRYNNWKVYADYLSNIITHYDELLDLSPSQFCVYHTNYFDVHKDILTDKRWKKTKAGRTSFSDTVVKLMRYEDVREKEIIPYLEKLGIKTCVYCNSQFVPTIHVEKGKVLGGYQLDHNWPKSEFPFLCTSFFNLYPVCSNCNLWKHDNRAEFVLYTDDYKQIEPFEFSLTKAPIVKYMLYQNPEVLDIKFGSGDKALRDNHEQLFHTDEYYRSFRDVAEELVWKSKTRNDVYKKQLINSFLKLFPRKNADVNRFLYGFYTSPHDIHQRPLTKLQQDIARQLGII